MDASATTAATAGRVTAATARPRRRSEEMVEVLTGMGLLLLEAVFQRDYPVISGVFLVTGVGILLINLLVDLTYGWLDPRVRHQ